MRGRVHRPMGRVCRRLAVSSSPWCRPLSRLTRRASWTTLSSGRGTERARCHKHSASQTSFRLTNRLIIFIFFHYFFFFSLFFFGIYIYIYIYMVYIYIGIYIYIFFFKLCLCNVTSIQTNKPTAGLQTGFYIQLIA